jgi:hypothetical protein
MPTPLHHFSPLIMPTPSNPLAPPTLITPSSIGTPICCLLPSLVGCRVASPHDGASLLPAPLPAPLPPTISLHGLIVRARFVCIQQPAGHHHPHTKVRLLHPPQIVRPPLHPALNRVTIPDVHPVNVKEQLHRLPWNTLRPVLPFFN